MNIERLRADTPGCAHVLHFNNAGASLMPQPVLQANLDHLHLESRIGGYEAAAVASQKTQETHRAIARLIGGHEDEVALLENATRAWGAAFYGMHFSPGDRIITVRADYASNHIAMLQVSHKTGAVIDVAPDDEYGQVDVAALEQLITPQTRLIAVTHIPTNGGLINPAKQIGEIARRYEVPFLLDACQSAGQVPLNVNELGCDMLSATGRKYLRGPRGTGFLWVKKDFIERLDPPFLDLHAADWVTPDHYQAHMDRRRFEIWEGNVAAKIALGVAAEYAMDVGLPAIEMRVQQLAATLRDALSDIKGVQVRDKGSRKSGIVTFTHPTRSALEIKAVLLAKGINTSVSDPDSALLDATDRDLPPMVRASVHYYNTEEEIDRFVKEIAHA